MSTKIDVIVTISTQKMSGVGAGGRFFFFFFFFWGGGASGWM